MCCGVCCWFIKHIGSFEVKPSFCPILVYNVLLMSSTQPYKCCAHKTTFLCQKCTTPFEFHSNIDRHSFRHCFHVIPFGQLLLCLYLFLDSYWNLFWYLNNNLIKISKDFIKVARIKFHYFENLVYFFNNGYHKNSIAPRKHKDMILISWYQM